jgi:hypothetical protein
MTIQVTVEDSGDSQEANIPVTLTVVQAGKPNITKHETIGFINQGDQRTVTFSDFGSPEVKPAVIKVEVQPVPGETKTDNNSADYPVIFSVA